MEENEREMVTSTTYTLPFRSIQERKTEIEMETETVLALSSEPADLMGVIGVCEQATLSDLDQEMSSTLSDESVESVGDDQDLGLSGDLDLGLSTDLVQGLNLDLGIDQEQESPVAANSNTNSVNGSGESDNSNRDRSSSLSETDCEESFSPEQPSHLNVADFAERSIPSPFSLPPAGSNFSIEGLLPFHMQTIDTIQSTSSLDQYNNHLSEPPLSHNSNLINDNRHTKSRTTTFHMNKPDFTTIPNPVKLFLPRQYTSHSCPTFSPFQTSSFSPFTSTSQELKSPILQDPNEWKNFFSHQPQEFKSNTFIGNKATFVQSGFLPFTSPILPFGNNEVKKM